MLRFQPPAKHSHPINNLLKYDTNVPCCKVKAHLKLESPSVTIDFWIVEKQSWYQAGSAGWQDLCRCL